MTTLLGNELYEHLSHLENEVFNLADSSQNSLENLAHLQLVEVLKCEQKFLKEVYGINTQPMMAFSGNGFPSIESLVPDLEKMCELNGDFKNIQERYQKEYFSNNSHDNSLQKVDKQVYAKRKKDIEKKRTRKKIKFGVRENNDKFEISVREKIYLDSPDSFSCNIPILARENINSYQVAWGRVFNGSEESFYVPNENLPVRVNNLSVVNKIGKDIGKATTIGGAKVFGSLFYSPTLKRKTMEDGSYDKKYRGNIDFLIEAGLFSSIFLGCISYILGPSILALPLATTIVSKFYEYGRSEKEKMIEKSKSREVNSPYRK